MSTSEKDVPPWATIVPRQLGAKAHLPTVGQWQKIVPVGPSGDSSAVNLNNSGLIEKAEKIK